MEGRYAPQERFAPWGPSGQERLARARAVVVGAGGLGGTVALLLARAGVGRLRLVDPDRVSLDNLHRQLLYSEDDAAQGLPKAQAGARALRAANGEIEVEGLEEELGPENAARLLAGAQVALDCLDRVRPRRVLNQACLELGIPWVHGGVVGARGQVAVVRPGLTPCFECWFPQGASTRETAATVGVIGPAAAWVASLQAVEAIKLLLEDYASLLDGLLTVDLWPFSPRVIGAGQGPHPACPVCGGRSHPACR